MNEENKSWFCNCLYFSAGSFARNMSRLSDEAFAKTGWPPSHAFVLMTVNRFEAGVSPSQVAQELHLTPSTVTRLIDKLEHKNLVTRELDGKNVTIKRTQKSMDLNKDLMEGWNLLFQNYQRILGKDFSEDLAGRLYDASETLKTEQSK